MTLFSKIIILFSISSTLFSNQYILNNIRYTAYNFIEESRIQGLRSPFAYNLVCYDWPGRFINSFKNYSSFRSGFDYLKWWCNKSFEDEIDRCYVKNNNNLYASDADMFNDIIQYQNKQNAIKIILDQGWDVVQKRLSSFYHNIDVSTPEISLQKGFIYFDEGNYANAIDQIEVVINSEDIDEILEDLNMEYTDIQLELAESYIETNQFEETISCLNKIIKKDPLNSDALFLRAIAYFEKKQFHMAFEDYLASGFRSTPIDPMISQETLMAAGLSQGIVKGCTKGLIDFLPSTLASIQGLGNGIWAFAEEPIQASKELVQAVLSCINYIKTHSTQETFTTMIPELAQLVNEWEIVDDFKRGEFVGYIIGKYGVDIFACAGAVKAISFYRELKKANCLFTFDTAIKSASNKEAILKSASIKKISEKNPVKIHWDRQNKHIPGSHNFQSEKGIVNIDRNKLEKLLDTKAGRGQKITGSEPYTACYVERVEFGEIIGEFALRLENGEIQYMPTTKGIIKHSRDGLHVIPSNPKAIIK